VNSYRDEESSMVALLEGKVKVSLSSSEFKVLKPGEQTIVKGGAVEVFPVDLSEAVAWKNGEFMFHNESMKSVMQKIARWYDVEVVVASELENISIWGSVSKYENISEVLKIIEMTGSVHFNIEGRRIHVMK
jgi:ferric-dicitrate binding protein FerR (iron transport regulator)